MTCHVRIRYRSKDNRIRGDRRLGDWPIRIGRNARNECPIGVPYVSDYHVMLELVDGRVCLRDLNSKNGTYTHHGSRLEPGRSVELDSLGNAFMLGKHIEVQTEVLSAENDDDRASVVCGAVLGNRSMMASDSLNPPVRGARAAASTPASSLPPLSADGWSDVMPPYVPAPSPDAASALPSSDDSRSLPPLAPMPVRKLSDIGPGRGRRPETAKVAQVGARPATEDLVMGMEGLALAGLRELAGSLLPGVALQTTGDIARLMTKLHDTVEVLCRAFVPLREGDAQSVYAPGAARDGQSRRRSPSRQRLERASDPAEVAAALLDWRNQDFDAPREVEATLLRVAQHHAALVDGVVSGAQALLDRLSPDALEGELEEQRGALRPILGGHRALWAEFKRRHEKLASDVHAFDSVFGPEFTASYRAQMARKRKDAEGTR